MAFSLAVVGVSVNAADLTWSVDTTVTVNSNNYTIQSGSAATSIVVGATTLTVVVPSGSQFSLISSNRYALNNDSSIIQSCSSGSNSVTITGAKTVVITPDATTTCTLAGSAPLVSSVSGGGGGGGGGGYVAPATTSTTTPTPTLTVSPEVKVTSVVEPGCSGGNKYNTSTGKLCINTVVSEAKASTTTGKYNFGTAVLKNGSKGNAVKELQRFLNDKLNLGLVLDGKLGPKTIAVIKKWQKANGLVADGLIGPKTKAMMNK